MASGMVGSRYSYVIKNHLSLLFSVLAYFLGKLSASSDKEAVSVSPTHSVTVGTAQVPGLASFS